MAKLQLNKVTKLYDNSVYGAKDVSFAVEDKEFAVLVGPSGCGKTTTLRLIAGLEEVTSGEILIENRCVNDVSPKNRDIAMVFQNYALYPHMTVFDNIAFGLRMRHFPKVDIEQRVNEAADVLGIKDLLQRKPKQLSGGQRQRVAVGRAIVRKPKLFLFDEPLSNLDAKLRVQMRAELSRLHKRLDATILYVTHDQVEAMTLGEKIVVLNAGEIQQYADPKTLYKKPKNKFVAGFIGSPPMNFITGLVTEKNRGIMFQSAEVTLKLDSAFKNDVGHEVIIGIRPHDFVSRKGSPLTIMVDVIEPMGNEIYIHGRCGNNLLSARLPEGVSARIGAAVTLRIEPARVYVFNAKTEETLA